MKIVSPLLKHVVYPGLSKAGYLRWPARAEPTVLTYHGILPSGYAKRNHALDGNLITADVFRSQLRLLKSKYNVISPEQFRLWCQEQTQLPPRSVLLTCDDGLLNALTDMLPIIREFDLPFMVFVTGASNSEQASMLWYERLYLWLHTRESVSIQLPRNGETYVAQTAPQKHLLWQQLIKVLSALDALAREEVLDRVRIQIGISENWLAEYSQHEPSRRRFFMLNRNDLQELTDAGMTIGAHTLSHPMLSQMPENGAFWEISENRRQLEKILGRNVWAFAYPFGTSEAVGKRDANLAERAGFTCAFLNMEEVPGKSKFELPRIHVSDGMTLAELEAHLCDIHRLVRQKYFHMMAENRA